MYGGKPIIGIVGGIGSGKSFVAGLFGELGCVVISSDQQVYQAYETAEVKETLRSWWGGEVFQADGTVDRKKIAAMVFNDPSQRRRLEELLHPLVATQREQIMQQAINNSGPVAFVWDTPLLYETGLHRQCDSVVFVECPWETRLERVRRQRAWSKEQLTAREKSQWALDKKRAFAEYTIVNTADAVEIRVQVREVLSCILAIFSK